MKKRSMSSTRSDFTARAVSKRKPRCGAKNGLTKNAPSAFTIVIDYRSAIEEFDRLWETSTTQAHQERMEKLLCKIEAFEKARLAHY